MMKQMLGNDFKYEDDLLYKIDKITKNWSCCNYLKPEKETGYIRVKVNGKKMRLNRLVYLFHYPDWDIYDISSENQIDHINEHKLDNSIENLRITNNSENNKNKTHKNGKLVKGVYFNKRDNRWRANWQENKKQKRKSFKTEIEAIECRAKMVEIHYTHHPSKRERN